jgi:hypothetical protein
MLAQASAPGELTGLPVTALSDAGLGISSRKSPAGLALAVSAGEVSARFGDATNTVWHVGHRTFAPICSGKTCKRCPLGHTVSIGTEAPFGEMTNDECRINDEARMTKVQP